MIDLNGRDRWSAHTEYTQTTGLYSKLTISSGNDRVVVFLKATRQIKRLDRKWNISADGEFLSSLKSAYGEDNVKTVAGKV